MSAATEDPRSIRISLRECRLMVHRLLYLSPVAHGAEESVCRYIVEMAAVDGKVLPRLWERSETELVWSGPNPVILNEDGRLEIDCNGCSLLFVGPAILDLITELSPRGEGPQSMVLRNVLDGDLLLGLSRIAGERGFTVEMENICVSCGLASTVDENGRDVNHGHGTDCVPTRHASVVTMTVHGNGFQVGTGREDDSVQVGPHVAQVISDGFWLDENLWWGLYERSIRALAPDTTVSRRHAGTTMVDADGVVHGEQPDGFDLNVYVKSDSDA